MKAPAEGDLIELDASDAVGHEQMGRRPGLVVSVDAFHESGLAFVCPVTTHGGKPAKRASSLEVPIPAGHKFSGVVLPHHLRAIDWKARRCEVVDAVPRATLLAVRARLKAILGT